jgi:hypothetical protein
MRRVFCVLAILSGGAAAAPQGCVGGVGITTFRIAVQPAGGTASNAVSLRQLNNIPVGYRITYRPIDLPADLRRDAKLTFVMVPRAADGQVTVLEPKLAATPAEWQSPFVPKVVLLVFAPQGLDEKRLTNLVTKDEALVSALADYADETAQLEEGLQAAREIEQFSDDEDNRAPHPATPAEQAIIALVRALNPAVSAYDPLAAGRRPGPTTMMGKGVGAFFDNAGGIVPGGGVLPAVKTWLMPDTEFRSVYAIPTESDGLTLCAQVQPKSRNKMAYVWAYPLTGASAPAIATQKETDAPIGLRASIPVKLDKGADWNLLVRAFDWTLISEGGTPPLRVPVRPVADDRSLQLDLRKFPGGEGSYRLQGKWDWSSFQVNGTLKLHRLEDLKTAHPTPESQDKLIAGSGPVPVDLTGADFLFVDRAWLHRSGSSRQSPVELPADRPAPSNKLRAEIETDGLRAGPYLLALARIDGAVTEIPVRLLPPPPRVDAAALRVNVGEREQRIALTGAGLDRLEGLESDRADFMLQPANDDGTRREAAVRLHADAKAGDRIALMGKVEGMSAAVRFPGILQVTAARPRIREAKVSLPGDLPVAPREGEIPAGSWVSYSMRVDPAAANASLTLQCAEPARMVQPLKLHLGEKQPGAQLATAGEGAWFLSLDPGAAGQSGCTLTAVMESDDLGKSDAFTLGKVVRLPRIENFSMTDEKSGDGFYGSLRGFDLETIEKTGWDGRTGVSVTDLPRPVAGEGARQTLRVSMPWPSPTPRAPLFVWLRGETEGRQVKVQP